MKTVRPSRTSLSNDVLRNFLFKEIFKGCCLLFSYQGSCPSFKATALTFYQSQPYFVKNFFVLFRCPSAGQLRHNTTFVRHLSTVFLQVFATFPAHLQLILYVVFLHDIIHNLTFNIQKLPEFSSSFGMISENIKRRRRDLNPRAATNDLLPFQGSPFGQLGYFSKMSAI